MAQKCKLRVREDGLLNIMLRLLRDEEGQAMAEYAILTSVTVAIAAWLYFPDNGIYQGFRHIFNKTALVMGWPGP